MKKLSITIILSTILFLTGCDYKKENIDYVNMYIGSKGIHFTQNTEYGGTTPAVSAPFGMTQWCAATRVNCISKTMYHYDDTNLIGFMATHQPCVWMGDYGYVTFMPQCKVRFDAIERAQKIDKSKEIATPYFYEVSFEDFPNGIIKTQLTATSRCGFAKITYPKGSEPSFMIEITRGLGEGNYIIDKQKREVRVYNAETHEKHISPKLKNLKGYYVFKFNKDIKDFIVLHHARFSKDKSLTSENQMSINVQFAKGTEDVEVCIGSSFIDYAQAEDNLNREIGNKSFAEVKESVKSLWSNYLNKVNIEGATDTERTMFYTSLFRTLQYPREFSEYGRYYSAFDDKVHNGVSYNAYSLWDTFRAQHPWLQIIAPERVDDMMQALVQMYKESGWFPKWPNPSFTNIMIGTHADTVIADAYINGFRNFDVKTAFEGMKKDATIPPKDDLKKDWRDVNRIRVPEHHTKWERDGYEARGGLTNYLKLGYVAADYTRESVSRTLEFALSDYCIAQMAKAMGNEADYKYFMKQSQNYKNLYNAKTAFFHAKNSDGSFHKNKNEGLTEASNWNYRFCVMQDAQGLIDLMGGAENFVKNLDEVFDGKHYRHDNEPSHHYVYMYNYCNRLDKAQLRIPNIIKKNYSALPDGLSGNDDCGQMSAWYLYSCMGFYPVCSASGEYALGIPQFKRITVALRNGKTLEIVADKIGKEKVLTNVSFNGKKLERNFIKVSDVFNGGKLVFDK